MKNYFDKLFIFEMANNHGGIIEKGIDIIQELSSVIKKFPDFKFAIKFQYRDLYTFIHPDYQEDYSYKYIKRFKETQLTPDEFLAMKKYAEEKGFLTACTPFDEESVDLIEEHNFDIIKIASCSLTDWLLIERIGKTDKPIVMSTASSSLEEIDNVVTFFQHRDKEICILHCMAEYPTADDNAQMNQLNLLQEKFPNVPVGYSTHEHPHNTENIKIAVAKGSKVFETHVDIFIDGQPINAYSSTPFDISGWLHNAEKTFKACGVVGKRHESSEKERSAMLGLRRGMWAKTDLEPNKKIKSKDVYFAIPCQEGQLTANDFSKYKEFTPYTYKEKDTAILKDEVKEKDLKEKVLEQVKKLIPIIQDSGVALPDKVNIQLSHHYGLNQFENFGAYIIDVVNREYCKKLLIMLPDQQHPNHFHVKKEETFQVLYGSMIVELDENYEKFMEKGDLLLVEREIPHYFYTDTGVIFEEISSTHYKDDSFYSDKCIMENNKDRKTNIIVRREFFDENNSD